MCACGSCLADGYPQVVETGFYIGSDKMIHGPAGRTGWSLVVRDNAETVWGRTGDTGFLLLSGCFYGPGGRQTSYYVVEEGARRVIHRPESQLPWEV